jgi:flagellar protein FliO/FliZ
MCPRNQRLLTRLTLFALLLPGWAVAAQSAIFAAPAAPATTTPTPGVARMLLALVAVLALLLGLAWVARRFMGVAHGGGQRLRVLSQLSLGSRERAVLIQYGEREILLGVANGNVRALLVSDAQRAASAEPAPLAPGDASSGATAANFKSTFRDILRRSLAG